MSGNFLKQVIGALAIVSPIDDRIGDLYHPFRFKRRLSMIGGGPAVPGCIEVHAVDGRFDGLHGDFQEIQLRSGS